MTACVTCDCEFNAGLAGAIRLEEAKWSSYSIGESDGLKVAAREARRRGKG